MSFLRLINLLAVLMTVGWILVQRTPQRAGLRRTLPTRSSHRICLQHTHSHQLYLTLAPRL